MLLIQLSVHDFLHGDVHNLQEQLEIHVRSEQTFLNALLEEAQTVLMMLVARRLQELQNTRHLMDFLIEEDAHIHAILQLLLVEEAEHIYHIMISLKHEVLHSQSLPISLVTHSGQQQFLFIAEYLIYRTLGHMKSLGDLIHLHSLDTTLVKLRHGIVYYLLS